MSDGAQWYVVHTYSGYENTVKATIEKYVENRGLQDLIHEISIPWRPSPRSQTTGPKRWSARSPRLCAGEDGHDRRVLAHRAQHSRRHRLPGLRQQAHPLSESDIAALGVEKREIVVGYEVGDSVKITDGALESFLGTVEEIDLDRSKVRVVVSMFGRETPWSWSWTRWSLLKPDPSKHNPAACRRGPWRDGTVRPASWTRRARPELVHIQPHFHMEVLFRGTESNWIRKTSDPRRQGDAGPCWPLLWASMA